MMLAMLLGAAMQLPDAPTPATVATPPRVKAFSVATGIGMRYSFRSDRLAAVPYLVVTYRAKGNRVQPAFVAAYNIQTGEWSTAVNVGIVVTRWGAAR